MPLPVVTIEGRLVEEPVLRFTPSGLAVAKLRMVASSRKKDEESGKWVDDKTLWINVTAWRDLAENCAESLGKGDLVVCVGKLVTNSWETKEGEKRSVIELTADSVSASLLFRTIKHGEGQVARSAGAKSGDEDPWKRPPDDDEPPF